MADNNQHAFRLVYADDGLGGAELMRNAGWVGVNERFSVNIVRLGENLCVQVYPYMHEDGPPLATMTVTGEQVAAAKWRET